MPDSDEELAEDLKAELGGNFEDVCLALLEYPFEYLADCLYDAMKGAGTDESCIIDVICTHKNNEIDGIKKAYAEKYKSELEEDLKEELSGEFKTLIRALLAGGRDESVEEDVDAAVDEAKSLQEAGVGTVGTDESFFTMILSSRSYGNLRLIFEAYKELAGCDIEDSIKSEFSGDLQAGLLGLVKSIRDVHAYYAERLHSTMKGPGTDDSNLIRILVSRAELDLQDIKECYRIMYGKELADAVADDTSGDYRKILLKIIN